MIKTLASFSFRGCLLALLIGSAAGAAADGFRRGVIVSCPRAGQIWGSVEMAKTLAELRSLGADSIAIHPYARVSRDGSVSFQRAVETGYLQGAVRMAREAEVRLFWKPHLAYWGSFDWRGAIEFGDDERAWQRFFEGYSAFIVDQARFAEQAGVDLFAVGVETEKTTHREPEWRRLIAAVRRVYSGRITYAANWDSLDAVPFWESLDLLGVHAYFPLAGEGEPVTSESIAAAWESHLADLSAFSRQIGNKPILFAEIGYSRSSSAASTPWLAGLEESPRIRELRRILIETAITKVEATAFIEGMFWWKWIPGDDRWDRDFSMKDPEAREALRRLWAQSGTIHSTAR